jgi:hypothetical protein
VSVGLVQRGVLMSGAVGTAFDVAVADTGPILYWHMDEDSGDAIDYSGNGRDGSWGSNVVRNDILGPDGRSYPRFNGTSTDSAGIGAQANISELAIQHTGTLTFVCLVRPVIDPLATTMGNLLGKGNANGSGGLEYVASHEGISSSMTQVIIRSGTDTNVWRRWVADFDGSSPTVLQPFALNVWALVFMEMRDTGANPRFWVDNVQRTTGLSSGGSGAMKAATTTSRLTVGAQRFANAGQFRGQIANFAVFDKVLSSGERDDLMTAAQADGFV